MWSSQVHWHSQLYAIGEHCITVAIASKASCLCAVSIATIGASGAVSALAAAKSGVNK